MSAAGCRVDGGPLPPLPGGASAAPERPLVGCWHALERRMGLDLRSLALFRVAFAALILWDLITRAPWIDVFYTQSGVLPLDEMYGRVANSVTRDYVSLHAANGHYAFQVFLFVLAAIAGVGLLIGWRTRLMTIVSWVLMVSLHNRHPLVLNAGDTLFRVLLFWSMFLPLGARWSVDSALNSDAVTEPGKRNNRLFNVPVICFLLQLCFVYWCTAALKSDHIWRTEHTAVIRALNLDYLIRPAGAWMATFPVGVLAFVNIATLVIEFGVPLLVWSPLAVGPLRVLAVVVMIGMHVSFALCMDIGLFSQIAAAAWLAILPPWFWDGVFARIRRNPRRTGATIWYDADCGFCQKMALFVRTLLLVPETAIRRCQEDVAMDEILRTHNSWVFQDRDGNTSIEFRGVVAALRHSPWAFPLAPVFGWAPIRAVGTGLYRFVANHRRLMGRLVGWATYAPRTLAPTRVRWVRDFGLAAVLVYVLIWNGRVFHTKKTFAEDSFQAEVSAYCDELLDPPGSGDHLWLGYATRLSQQWNMFAPKPPSTRGWFEIIGTLADGTKVELFDALVWDRDPQPPTGERPARVSVRYPNARWRKYIHHLQSSRRKRHRALFCKWLAREWKARHAERPLAKVWIYYEKERIAGDGSITPAGRLMLWRYTVK